MSDSSELLLELRDIGIRQLPEPGDAGDRRVQEALDREMTGTRPDRLAWFRRRIKIGGFAVTPVVLMSVVATAAAATTAAVTLSATSLFQADPQGLNFNGDIETVLPATVRQVATVNIPDYGQVAVWGATTKPGGFCFALKLPNGDWGGLNQSEDAQDGWDGGAIPGCAQTRQQAILRETPLQPGQQPSGTTGQLLMPTAKEQWDNEVKNSDGTQYTLYVGYVEVQGTAATVLDTDSNLSTPVMPDGYYVLAEPTLRCSQIQGMASAGGTNATTLCDNGDNLEVLNAAGQQLKPDYTWGGMLPGYTIGPTAG